MNEQDEARFWGRVALPNEQGCMLWLAGMNSDRYGSFRAAGRSLRAHRVSYELAYGSIPEGLVIDHLCRVRHCVTPDHLEAVTSRENTLRGETVAAHHARKTHCPRGHAYDETNTLLLQGRRRDCRACGRIRRSAYEARQKALLRVAEGMS